MSGNREITIEEDQLIQGAYDHLITTYLATNHRKHTEIIAKAFQFAHQAHKGVRRQSGEAYIFHPLAVAQIVCAEIGLGSTSISAALLHDVVEDTDYTVADLEQEFGSEVALLVDGLTKLAGGMSPDKVSAQAENYRKLFLTMSKDIRVILIKIGDRLHNMRTLGSLLPYKQFKIAGETQYIYAPLAHRLGLSTIKTELEDLSFKYEHLEAYQDITSKLKATETERDAIFTQFRKPIEERLEAMKITYRIEARVKSAFSIWNKMQTKNVSFDEVFDLFAVRIVFYPIEVKDENATCFAIYSAIADLYNTHPDRFRDFVNNPKANGYQSLHFTAMGDHGEWVEVQIRSDRMNQIAEQGVAAHWKYKAASDITDSDGELDRWLKTVKEILDNPDPSSLDFLEKIKMNLFAAEIFVFSPKGDLITIPNGATALDYAFQIHSKIGNHSIGAKVNHKLVPLSQKLQSGDQVEILTSKSQKIQPEWLKFAVTAKARTIIEQSIKRDLKRAVQAGEALLSDYLEKEGIPYDLQHINKMLAFYKLRVLDELLQQIGIEKILLNEDFKSIFKKQYIKSLFWTPFRSGSKEDLDKTNELSAVNQAPDKGVTSIDRKKPVLLTHALQSKNYQVATCCEPIPGDDVLGYISENGLVVVHRRECKNAMKLKSTQGDSIVSVKWNADHTLYYPIFLEISGLDRSGLLSDLTTEISSSGLNIRKLSFESIDGYFTGKVQLDVQDVDNVNRLCKRLLKLNSVKSVVRVTDK